MRPERRPHRDDQVEQVVSLALRTGVGLAAAVAGIGGLLYLAANGALPASYSVFTGQPAALRSVGGILRGALALRSEWIIALGLLVLIATPVVRVALLIIAFARQRDRLYVGVSAIVLTVLLLSFWNSRG